jgi:hypothetical protein
MSKRKDLQPATREGNAKARAMPQRPQPNEPETPGKKRSAKATGDAVNKAARRGER